MTENPSGGTKINGDANIEDGDFVVGDKFEGDKIELDAQLLLEALNKFNRSHLFLNEWEEVQKRLIGILVALGMFSGQIEFIESVKEEKRAAFLSSNWNPTLKAVDSLKDYYGKEIKHIMRDAEGNSKGADWAGEMVAAEEAIDQSLKVSPINAEDLSKITDEFEDILIGQIQEVNEELLRTVIEIVGISSTVLEGLKHE
jgi:hypothetical protein